MLAACYHKGKKMKKCYCANTPPQAGNAQLGMKNKKYPYKRW